jgi:hypothetical protein
MRAAVLLLAALTFVPCAAWPQGNPLGPEFRVNTYTTSYQESPSIAADSSGNFVVVWRSSGQDGSGQGVFGQRYAASGPPLGPEFRVNAYTTSTQNHPSVASDASGNFVVVWPSYDQDGSLGGVFGQRYASSGTPLGHEFRVNTYTPNLQRAPSVAAGPSGDFVVVWESDLQDGSGKGVFGQRYSSSGPPLGSEFRVNTYTTSDQSEPSVAADSAGNFVVVWTSSSQDGSVDGVFGQRYASSGAPVGSEFRVNTYTTGHQDDPSVAVDASGNFVVVWYGFTGDAIIHGQRYSSSGVPLGNEFDVDSLGVGYSPCCPAVAADPDGNFVVVWTSVLPFPSNIESLGQRYASSGIPLGPRFRVNTYTTGTQGPSSVAADPSGFIVVWESAVQDGSGYGVFGQRYRPILPVELMQFRVE